MNDSGEYDLRKCSSDVTTESRIVDGISLASVLTKEQLRKCESIPSPSSGSVADIPLVGGTKDSSSIELQRLPSADINRRCWICYACENDDDAPDDELVHPCGCKGSTKWVHQTCINQWIDEVQGGNASKEIRCPYCRINFAYEFPTPPLFYRCLSLVDTCHAAFCNTIVAGHLWSMLGFTAIASNATKVFKEQIKEVVDLLREGSNSPLQQLALGFCIQLVVPTSLIILEQHLSTFEDRFVCLLDSNESSGTDIRVMPPPAAAVEMDGVDNIHQIVAALLFPTMSDTVGSFLYGSIIANSFHRYLMGSITFMVCRGVTKVLYKRKQLSLQRKRKVKNKDE